MQVAPIALKKTIADACADALRASILRGELAAGERLPAERALAERLGVNRITLRAALTRLATERLIEAKHGSGHVVLDYRHLGGPNLVGMLFESATTTEALVELTEDILQIRRALARLVMARLVTASKPALEPVHAAIAQFVALPADAGDIDVAAADLLIVRALLDATGRPALQLFWNPVLAILRDAPRLRAAMYANPKANAKGWTAFGAWLAMPRRERAKAEDASAMLENLLLRRDELVLDHLRKS